MIVYKKDGRDPVIGWDCWGPVLAIYTAMGFSPIDPAIDPEGAERQWDVVYDPDFSLMDVLAWGSTKNACDHVGILLMDNTIIHQAKSGFEAVRLESINVTFGYRWNRLN